jgi:hypothetical protein
LQQQKYLENQELKGMVFHSKPYIVKISNFIVDFGNKKKSNCVPIWILIKIKKKEKIILTLNPFFFFLRE